MERGNSDIYVTEADGGGLRRLTSHTSEDILPDWSQDGNLIYYVSKRTGTHQIWKVLARGGPEVQVTQRGGWEPRADPAGVFIYYTAAAAPAEFRRLPSKEVKRYRPYPVTIGARCVRDARDRLRPR
jgi:Tol biopolymer transport system component